MTNCQFVFLTRPWQYMPYDLVAFCETEGACSALTNTGTLRAWPAERLMTNDYTQPQDELEKSKSQQLSRQRSRPPADIAGYDTRQFLGAGAYGEVWVAVDQNTGRKVAIKFYTKKSGVDWSLLSREVEKLVFLSADRYVVQLLDVGWDADPPYYVMEYVDGGSLQQFLEEEGPLPVGEAVEMIREIATGLLHAHGKGVLHCDLKPDNILLDQDRKPRLADFGQSRLSHEQTPALGTLFYMAPEQADLEAVPDARWDVYALGALLYCMLTGRSPHRSTAALAEIDSSPTLVERLETYRKRIRESPPPEEHRKLPGVDRELADIVDRCLAVAPERRFPNVQSVLTAIRARDATKDRKPLLLLGLLGPLLFLAVLAIFGGSAYRQSVDQSDRMLRRRVRDSNQFAAKYVSEAVARRIDNFYRLVEDEAQEAELQRLVSELQSAQEMKVLLPRLVDDSIPAEQKGLDRDRFVGHELRASLDSRMDWLIQDGKDDIASWFVTDANGLQLASAIPTEEKENSTVGFDYSRRAYFHGGTEDYPAGRHYPLPPLKETKLSPVFRSDASATWKVAISTPIFDGKKCIGIVALTVELGHLGSEEDLDAIEGVFVTLVDGREGPHRGQILQHPLFNEVLIQQASENPNAIPKLRDYGEYLVPLDRISTASSMSSAPVELYHDPLGDLPEGKKYNRNWIAAKESVQLATLDTGLVVLVQEDYDLAREPVRLLGEGVRSDGLWALALILMGVFLLWALVARALRDPNEALRRSGGTMLLPSSLHSMETIELPEKFRKLPS